MLLEKLRGHPDPHVLLEQYTIPARVAANILFIACYVYGDIKGKVVYDLGCGTGRLAIGAAILGARRVIGVDVDPKALRVARINSVIAGVVSKVEWILGDVEHLSGKCDVVVQNPPFGVQRRGADRKFIVKALEIGSVIYSLHKSNEESRKFIRRLVKKYGGRIDVIICMDLPLRPVFPFHRKRIHVVKVDLYRIVKGGI
ncbi:MAG: METTL5 family protein [Candidatus Baldrarchaeia archaeon]